VTLVRLELSSVTHKRPYKYWVGATGATGDTSLSFKRRRKKREEGQCLKEERI
jgi:hypothetical protein